MVFSPLDRMFHMNYFTPGSFNSNKRLRIISVTAISDSVLFCFFCFFPYLFIHFNIYVLAAPGLSRTMWDLVPN